MRLQRESVEVVSVSLPQSLLRQLDGLAAKRGFAGRSEAVRAALRDFLGKELQEPNRGGERTATMTLVYPKGHERRIGDIRHEFSDVIKSLTHSDPGGDCVEVFLLQGPSERLRQFSDRLRSYRESRLVQLVYTDAAEAKEAAKHDH